MDIFSYYVGYQKGKKEGGGGGTDLDAPGVLFIDYDGTPVKKWGAAEVASQAVLPENPSHTGLVAQGWNWTLADIKSYMADYPNANLCVGQMYATASGLSEFDIVMNKVTGKTVTFMMAGNKNWGDGTSNTDTSHTYQDYGEYTITCDGTSIPGGSSSKSGVFECTSSSSTIINCYFCKSIRLSNQVTTINTYAFGNCRALTSVTIPVGVTTISSNAFNNCRALTSVTIPVGVTAIYGVFKECYALTNVIIPAGMITIDNGTFQSCYALTNITIPAGVTEIDNDAFHYCYALTNITIPAGVTRINSNTFQSCQALTNITIPAKVSQVGSNAFNTCYALISCDFSKHTSVPSLSNVNAFSYINYQCKIIVPDTLYEDWIVATNWANYANYIYKASEVTE